MKQNMTDLVVGQIYEVTTKYILVVYRDDACDDNLIDELPRGSLLMAVCGVHKVYDHGFVAGFLASNGKIVEIHESWDTALKHRTK